MQFAYPEGVEMTDPSRRIKAEDHKGEEAVCPLHGCRVVSRLLDGVWQWVHEGDRQSHAPKHRKRR